MPNLRYKDPQRWIGVHDGEALRMVVRPGAFVTTPHEVIFGATREDVLAQARALGLDLGRHGREAV